MLNVMSETDGNAAKKVKPEILDDDTSEVDDQWDPSEESPVAGERKEDQFVYTESKPPKTKEVQEDIGSKTREVTKGVLEVSAEDLLSNNNAQMLLLDILDREDLDHPPQMYVIGGANTQSERIYMPFESGVACAQSSPGQTPSNQDGIMASYDEARKRLRLLLAHGPQGDAQSADLANLAAVKSAYEEVANPDSPLKVAYKNVDHNLAAVKAEFGIADKETDVIEAELQIGDRMLHELSVSNTGNNHCFILDPESGETRPFKKTKNAKRSVTRAELESLYQRLQDRVSPEGTDRLTQNIEDETDRSLARSVLMSKNNPVDLAEALIRALEKEVLTDAGKENLRYYVNSLHEGEVATPEKIIDTLAEYFEEDSIKRGDVVSGEIVVIANDELMKSIEAHKGAHDIQLGNRFFMEIQSGKGLREICSDVVEEAEKKQDQEQIPDSSLSIIAFEVPSGGLQGDSS